MSAAAPELPLQSDAPPGNAAALRASRAAALALALALVALSLAWELWLEPIGRGTLAIKVLPLLPALPGLWRMRLYTYRWTSLLVWLYVAEGATRAGGEPGIGRWLAVAEVLLAIALFAACAWHVRTQRPRPPKAARRR